MSSEPTLLAQDMRVIRGNQAVLDSVNLEMSRGEVVVVRGESGCGKTTLVHALSGLFPLDAGSIFAMGTPVVPGVADRIRRSVLALMTQDLHLLGALDPVRNAAIPLLLAGRNPKQAMSAAHALLVELGLDPSSAPQTSRLSRGQRQRVALARVLVHPRPILLLDEPTSSLDPRTRDRVLKHLSERAAEGASILLTSHDEALSIHASRTLVFSQGRLVSA